MKTPHVLAAAFLFLAACGLEQGSGRPCTLDGECSSGEACDVGLGLCVVACDPVGAVAAGCAEGFGCRLRTIDASAGVCRLDEGVTVGIGDACESTAQCPFGALCGSGQCLELCQASGDRELCEAPANCVNVEPLSPRFGVCLR